MTMNCIHFRKRTKKHISYFYCVNQKREIKLNECCSCKVKEYKGIKSIKGKKHKRTIATDISQVVKKEVWERDLHRCIFCKKQVPLSNANAHFIPRSAGGLGISQNIITACNECHNEQDNGKKSIEYDRVAEKYLKKYYGDKWDKKKLIYNKYERGE